jgi:hypothetical protein
VVAVSYSDGAYGSSTPSESYDEWKQTTKYQLKPAGWALVFILVSLLSVVLFTGVGRPDYQKKEKVEFSIKGVPFTLSRESK